MGKQVGEAMMASDCEMLGIQVGRARVLAAVGLLVLGLIVPGLQERFSGEASATPRGTEGSNSQAPFLKEWSPIEAPLGRFVHVEDFERVLSTGEFAGSFEFGPIAGGMLELRLYLEPGSSAVPEWKLAWLPVTVSDANQEAFCLSLDGFLNVHRMRGEVERWQSGLRVIWRFPEPARKVRIALPAFCRLRIAGWQAVVPGDPGKWTATAWQRRVWRLTGLILACTCAGLAAMLLWPQVIHTKMLEGFGLVIVAASFLITVFGLPPFQGPDEQDHWRDALLRYRRHAVEEKLLYNLPEITGFDRVRWRVENGVSPTLFRATGADITPITERKFVNYAWYHSYPMVAVVAWCFPRVETVNEALIFYYLCRLLPVLVIFALLYWFWRRDHLPAFVLAIFSIPYVQQQCTVISTDTLANLAAISAGLTFLALRRLDEGAANGRNWLACYTALWLMALLAFLAKPPIYVGLFLLPLWATFWRRWRPVLVLSIGGSVVLVLTGLLVLVIWRAYRAMHELPVADQFRQQLEFLIQQGGWRYFLQQPLAAALDIPLHFNNWCMPLGWVDTYFHAYHLGVLQGLVATAIAMDLLRALLLAPSWLNRQALLHLVVVLVIGLLLFAGTWVLTALTMYLAVTPPRHPFIYGMQVRYLFPCLLACMWLPLTVRYASNQAQQLGRPFGHETKRQGDPPNFSTPTSASVSSAETITPRATHKPFVAATLLRSLLHRFSLESVSDWLGRMVTLGWTATLLVLSLARLVGLFGDLLARYW